MLYCITHLFMGLWGVCTFGLLMQSTALVLSSQILDFSTVGEKRGLVPQQLPLS